MTDVLCTNLYGRFMSVKHRLKRKKLYIKNQCPNFRDCFSIETVFNPTNRIRKWMANP